MAKNERRRKMKFWVFYNIAYDNGFEKASFDSKNEALDFIERIEANDEIWNIQMFYGTFDIA